MLTKNITRTAKIIGLSCLLPSLLQVPNVVASESYGGSLLEVVKNGGKAGKDEGCLVSGKVSEAANSSGLMGTLGKFGGALSSMKDKAVGSLFNKSVYCKKNIISVMLQTGEEIDLAVVQTADALHAALQALDYKAEDLHELAQIKKAELGTKFTGQALGNVEDNSEVVQQWATELSKAVEERKEKPLGPEAEQALAKAVGNVRGAIFHQTKTLIGSYLIQEYFATTPKKQILAMGVHYEKVGLTDDFIFKLPSRTLDIAGNVGTTFKAMKSAEQVLDDSELNAIIETTGDAAIDRERKESIAAAKQIEQNSSFADLPSAQDQMKVAEADTDSESEVEESDEATDDTGGSKAIEAAKKLWPWK